MRKTLHPFQHILPSVYAFCASVACLVAPAIAGEEPVVVELFTSQGDSSSPAADKVLAQLAEIEDVIALSWSVSLWDYTGWKDTLAIPLSNERHAWYNRLSGTTMIYTPQVFVDGEKAHVGSHSDEISATIESHRGDASAMVDITFDTVQSGWVTLDFDQPPPQGADVRIIFFDDRKVVEVSAGENTGKTLTYTNVVRGAMTLNIDPTSATYRVDLSSVYAKNCDAFAVLIQDRHSAKMLGAAVRRLKDKTT